MPRVRMVRLSVDVRAVDVVDGVCSIHRGRARCGALNGADVLICAACAMSIVQLIGRSRPAAARPHKRHCLCADCIAFDEGQRGELAQPEVLRDGPVALSCDGEAAQALPLSAFVEVD